MTLIVERILFVCTNSAIGTTVSKMLVLVQRSSQSSGLLNMLYTLDDRYHTVKAELPSLPIYREISRKYSKINPISRSPGFDLQSPAKESFCLFYANFFFFFGRRTVLPAVSHLRYTESAESSRAETIEVYPTAGSVTCWPSRSMQAAAATV